MKIYIYSKLRRKNISIGTKLAMQNPLVRKKISIAKKGKPSNRKGCKCTKEQKERMSKARIGQIAWNKGLKASEDKRVARNVFLLLKNRKPLIGKDNPSWKGDSVGYGGVHDWIKKKYGHADYCENKRCYKKSKNFEWANISGKYKRDRKDYLKLCRSCHRRFDKGSLSLKEMKG